MYKITVTGTKGKTTIVRLLDYLFLKQGKKTLRVDNDGWYYSGRIKGDTAASKKIFGLIPSVCPGKFLLNSVDKDLAIMEASVGSSGAPGLGYKVHDIGIMTNVYKDHISETGRLKNRGDILKAKSFIYKRIVENGYAVGNVDESYVQKALRFIPEDRLITFVPYGVKFNQFDLANHLRSGGRAIGLEEKYIILYKGKRKQKIVDVTKVPITFGGKFMPSITNIMAVIASFLIYNNWKLPAEFKSWLYDYTPAESGARLVYKEIKGRKVLIDFAHEEESLKQVLKLGKKMGKRCSAVLRIAPDRTNKQLAEIGSKIARLVNEFYVWDKIDGKHRKSYKNTITGMKRSVGEVSGVLVKEIKKKNKQVQKFLLEDKAIKQAIDKSEEGDCLVIISGDDREKTLEYVRKYFSNL